MALFKKKGKTKTEAELLAASPDGAAIDAEEVMRKYDRESNTRIWEGVPKIAFTVILVAFSVYCMAMTLLSVEQAEARLARFLAFIVVIGYLMFPEIGRAHV